MDTWESSSAMSAPPDLGAERVLETEGGPERASPVCGDE